MGSSLCHFSWTRRESSGFILPSSLLLGPDFLPQSCPLRVAADHPSLHLTIPLVWNVSDWCGSPRLISRSEENLVRKGEYHMSRYMLQKTRSLEMGKVKRGASIRGPGRKCFIHSQTVNLYHTYVRAARASTVRSFKRHLPHDSIISDHDERQTSPKMPAIAPP